MEGVDAVAVVQAVAAWAVDAVAMVVVVRAGARVVAVVPEGRQEETRVESTAVVALAVVATGAASVVAALRAAEREAVATGAASVVAGVRAAATERDTRTPQRSPGIDSLHSALLSRTCQLRQSTTARMVPCQSCLHRGSATHHTSLQMRTSCHQACCSPTHRTRLAAMATCLPTRGCCTLLRIQLACQMAPRSTASCRHLSHSRSSCSDHHRSPDPH